MSAEEFTRGVEECRKALNALRKDIEYRQEQANRAEPTYSIDAEIRGQFAQIHDSITALSSQLAAFKKNPKDYGLQPREVERRQQALDANIAEREKLRLSFERSLTRSARSPEAAAIAANLKKLEGKDGKMDRAQLQALKKEQEGKQEQVLDQLLGAVRGLKSGQGEIRVELQGQETLLQNLEKGVDDNNEQMSKARRNIGKLMDGSSYSCLVLVILLEIAGIVCNLMLWHK